MLKKDTVQNILDQPTHWPWALTVTLVLAIFPWVASEFNADFYITLGSRILIYALIATSLNLILGFAGLVSFGHAAFVGIGAYSIVILMDLGVTSAFISWPLAMFFSAIVAWMVGAISLRTKGVYFIMITLAFAQMLFYLVTSLKLYGGNDGMSLYQRSTIEFGSDSSLNISNETNFYYLTLSFTGILFILLFRLLNSRFGHVLQAIRENEERMLAVGFPVFRYKLLAFVISGSLAGLGGALTANLSGFVSPSLMQWTQSGMMLIMVTLGGVGYVYGGFLGAFTFLVLEEILSSATIHWQLGLGTALLIVVLFFPNGLSSMFEKRLK